MERTVTVEFGPSRSKRFAKALAFARERADECVEVEPGKYRASFELGSEPGPYNALHALIREVRYWRATVVSEDDEPVSDYHAKEMAFCAASQLQMFGDCHWRFYYGVLPRCSPSSTPSAPCATSWAKSGCQRGSSTAPWARS